MQRLPLPLRRRTGFTLVELLVVMALIVVLAALMIGFFPSVATSAREARAAQLLQSWLNIAKQRALRDQTPTGLRLLIIQNSPKLEVVECQYISQPEDFWIGKIYTSLTNVSPPYNKITFDFSRPATGPALNTKVDLVNGYSTNLSDLQFWAVQPGDFIEINGTGVMHRVISIDDFDKITVAPPLPYPIPKLGWASYRVVRGSRTLGDEPLKLPENTVIDIDTNTQFTVKNPLPISYDSANGKPLYIDILFAPSGQVISRGLSVDKLHLWVRVPNPDDLADPFRGDPTLVSIYAHTGFVGAYSPDPTKPGGNPYGLVK
jgi:prepilin-type N-terminal cleavage/methylation domain-containing protein